MFVFLTADRPGLGPALAIASALAPLASFFRTDSFSCCSVKRIVFRKDKNHLNSAVKWEVLTDYVFSEAILSVLHPGKS